MRLPPSKTFIDNNTFLLHVLAFLAGRLVQFRKRGIVRVRCPARATLSNRPIRSLSDPDPLSLAKVVRPLARLLKG